VTRRAPWVITATKERSSARHIVDALAGRTEPLDLPVPPPGDGPGAIVFDEADERVLALAREHCRDGQRRVLAIATAAQALAGDAPWQLLDAGAADVVAWDGCAQSVLLRLERWAKVDELVGSELVTGHLVGSSAVWRSVLRDIVEVGYFSDVDVLISGESGTGKELAAQLIHTLDQRPRKQDLVVVDCTTIVPSLSGSELFGHERGAFTGAVAAREGAFALADGGTLMLDEVGELPHELQAELLRVVQEGTYKRVGSNRWQKTRFRLVCATNRDLEADCEAGTFRSDLFFRLAAARIRMPALRQRAEDVACLAEHFVAAWDGEAPPLSEPVRELLLARAYPGNVRDLKQLMARIGLRHVGPGPVTVGDVPPAERPAGDLHRAWQDELEVALSRAVALGVGLREIVDVARDIAISQAVRSADGSLRHAASRLGVTDRTLQLHRQRQRNPHPA
jgi:transcriptional regulator with GAF, ATPase, and Fis domain